MKNTLKTPQSKMSSNNVSFIASSTKKRVSKDGISTPLDSSFHNSFAKKSLNLNSSFSYSKSSQQNVPAASQAKLNTSGFLSKFKEQKLRDKADSPHKTVHELNVNPNPNNKGHQ